MRGIHGPRKVPGSVVWLARPGGPSAAVPGEAWVADGAEAAPSAEPGAWILGRLAPFAAGRGTPVGGVIPGGFDAYARILHPARSGARGDDPVRWSEVAAWSGRAVHPEVQWEALIRPIGRTSAPPPWSSEPETGNCPPEVLTPLVDLLRQSTSSDRCWAGVWHGWGGIGEAFPEIPLLKLPYRDHLLFSVSSEVLKKGIFEGAGAHAGPAIWWPEDRTWCVVTEVDFRWTYVGGPHDCIERILSAEHLEALPSQLDHRADYLSDTRNGPVAP
jgi:hypothetical protein